MSEPPRHQCWAGVATSLLSECHPDAEGEVLIELTKSMKAIDPTLVSKLQTWGNVFDQPDIDTTPRLNPDWVVVRSP